MENYFQYLNESGYQQAARMPSATVANRSASNGRHGPFQPAGPSTSANPIAASSSMHPLLTSAAQETDHYPSTYPPYYFTRLLYQAIADEGPPLEDLPMNVACTLHHRSAVTSMEFHPSHPNLLLVGCAGGEVIIWNFTLKVASKPFMVWDMRNRSSSFQDLFPRYPQMSVHRALWSPDGGFIGVAFSMALIHLFAYTSSDGLQQVLEVEAHYGGVNDLAFVYPNNQLCIATCGDDWLVKVWDFNGQQLFSFTGHRAPVYSLCPSSSNYGPIMYSTSIDGEVRTWTFNDLGYRLAYFAPGYGCTTFRFSDDRTRLFSCGTSQAGQCYLLEWENDGCTLKRNYSGLMRRPANTIAHFDTTQNKFLAVGEDSRIKFWYMNKIEIFAITDAEGALSSQPRVKFNKPGNLLAVTTANDGIKILATSAFVRQDSFPLPGANSNMPGPSAGPIITTCMPNLETFSSYRSSSSPSPGPIINESTIEEDSELLTLRL